MKHLQTLKLSNSPVKVLFTKPASHGRLILCLVFSWGRMLPSLADWGKLVSNINDTQHQMAHSAGEKPTINSLFGKLRSNYEMFYETKTLIEQNLPDCY